MNLNQPITQRNKHYELEISFLIIIVLSGIYIAYDILAEPRVSHPFGHWLGIIGTILMVMTEMLYSLRKRTRLLNWAGPMRRWLSFHIITGLVGPFLVLMHTGLQFRGLAGVTFGLTVLVVGSGFIGRYLYTALQQQVGVRARSSQALAAEMAQAQAFLQQMEADKPDQVRQIATRLQQQINRDSRWGQWRYRQLLRRELRRLEEREAAQQRQLAQWQRQQAKLERQMDQLGQTRQMFQLWHTVHIPIGVTLFVATAVHILAAFYFRAGLFK
ncbi:MAG: hypothetical protein R3E31_02275 [Chloroflexota bacterium]